MSRKERLAAELGSLNRGRRERDIASHLDLLAEWSRRVERAGFDPREFA